MKKRGQAAVEYLITYGWAFLIILGTVAVLSYFGLLNPQRYIPSSCEFGSQLECVDMYVDDGGDIILRFQNNFDEDITIVDATGLDVGHVWGTLDIDDGNINRVDLTTTRDLFAGSKERFEISFEFRRRDGTNTYIVTGVMFTEVVDDSLGLVN